MIALVRGTIAAKSPTHVVIDAHGVGYEIAMPGSAIASLPGLGEKVTVLTHLHVREDEMSLFGFRFPGERSLFRLLISVSGVGPKAALALLSALTPEQLADAVAREDYAIICETPGVGKKLAQRLVMELKDKLELPDLAGTGSAGGTESAAFEARDALVGMGFTATEASAAVKSAPEGSAVGAIVTHALKRLGSGR